MNLGYKAPKWITNGVKISTKKKRKSLTKGGICFMTPLLQVFEDIAFSVGQGMLQNGIGNGWNVL